MNQNKSNIISPYNLRFTISFFIVKDTLPQTRQIETVFESIPKQTCCVVIHEHYVKIVSSNEINGNRDFLFDCTLLAIGGKFVELQMVITGDGTTHQNL
jgi:hypothetical protein